MFRGDRAIPLGCTRSSRARVFGSGTEPGKPRKKSWPTFSSRVRRRGSFMESLRKSVLFQLSQKSQRLDGSEMINVDGTQRVSQLFLNRGEKRQLIHDYFGLPPGTDGQIIGQLVLGFFMFF